MEQIPSKVHVGNDWLKPIKKSLNKVQKTETAAEGGTLMGRLAERMASRDMIDELNLGPKGQSKTAKMAQIADGSANMAKVAQIADDFERYIPSKLMLGAGQHVQTSDTKASNFSDPMPKDKESPGSNMADQAKASGNVFNSMKKGK